MLRIEAIHKCLKAPEKQAAKKVCAVREKQSNFQLTYCLRNEKARVKRLSEAKAWAWVFYPLTTNLDNTFEPGFYRY